MPINGRDVTSRAAEAQAEMNAIVGLKFFTFQLCDSLINFRWVGTMDRHAAARMKRGLVSVECRCLLARREETR